MPSSTCSTSRRPGVAEAEFESDPASTLRNMLHGASGEGVAAALTAAATSGATSNLGMVPKGERFLRGPGRQATLPVWLTEADVDFYANEFKRTGFRGPLNYYRNLDRNWEIQAALSGAQVTVPALYVAGDRDFIVLSPGMDRLIANLNHFVPGLRKVQMLPGCGHWTQQERAVKLTPRCSSSCRGLPA